jgi:class 3 adenylate cyclase/tetratricopeptide (TPR) repeat protein
MAEGRPETVTVMFTDVVGSTAWRGEVGDEVADVRTAELERASREVVASSGGTVVKSVGDGVMATFTSAVSALDAADALQVVARRLAVGGSNDCLRIGVSSGDMVREGGDWLGAAAIEASRLCAVAAGGSVLVADATVRLCRGRSNRELRLVGGRVLRGFDVAVEVYELISARGGDSLPPVLAQAVGGPLVGRHAELARVGSPLGAVAAGAARTLFIVGEAGVGKTRLAGAVAVDAVDRGFAVLYGRCVEGLAAPYQPVVEALGPWLEDCPDAALTRVLGPGGAELVNLWPELAPRLEPPSTPSAADPEAQRWRLFEAVVGLVRSIAAERPLILVVDDLQWAEPSTLLLLTHMVRRAVGSTAVVATVRTAESVRDPAGLLGDLGTGCSIDILDLDGLGREDVAELVSMHAGARPPNDLSQQLHRQTDGNPFFLAALLAHLDEVAFVRRDEGTWLTAAELDAVGVPEGVRGVIGRRLSLLSAGSRRALDVAAVAGLAFTERIVRGVLGSGLDDTVDALDEAIAAGLLREEVAGRFAFAHALVRQTVLDNLSRTRVARLHWRIAEELERDVADRTTRVGEIAYHYTSGGDVGDAATVVRAALAAGDDALRGVAFEEAARHFRAALAVLDRMAPDPDLRYRVLISLGHTLNALREPDEAQRLWLQAGQIAMEARDPARLFAAFLSNNYVWRIGDETELVRLLDGVLDLLGPTDSPLRASALGWKAAPSQWSNPLRPTHGDACIADDAVAMARRTGDPAALTSTLLARVSLEAQGSDAQAMLRDAEELNALRPAAALDATHGDIAAVFRYAPWRVGPASELTLTRALLRLGRRAEAEQHLASAQTEAENSALPMDMSAALMLRAALATASGRFAEAKRMATEGAQRAGRHGTVVELGYAAQILASRMEEGRLDEVIASLRELDRTELDLPAWRAMLAGALADAGHHAEASAELGRLTDNGLPAYATPLAVRHLPEVCRQLGESVRAAALLAHVESWTAQILVVTEGTSIEGGSDRSIGHLLATLGRLDEADVSYTAAARLERSAGFPPLVARTEYWHARALLERNARHDRERARALLDEVADITARLGMSLLLEQAAGLLAQVNSAPR